MSGSVRDANGRFFDARRIDSFAGRFVAQKVAKNIIESGPGPRRLIRPAGTRLPPVLKLAATDETRRRHS
jgi:hypothetical protein